tara:strand:+ start:248 stop:1168 length:921 start_codon:yes stop_codon:yes gene_type:complete
MPIHFINNAADEVVPKVESGLLSVHKFLYDGNGVEGKSGSAPYRAIVDNGSRILNVVSEELNKEQDNPVSQLVADYLTTDPAESIGRPVLNAAGFNENSIKGLLFLPGLLGMVRGKADVSNLKKLSPNDLAVGNFTNSVEKAFAKGQRQYVKNGEIMDAGWKPANFGSGLYETAPYNPARRRERSAERRARQLQGTATKEMFIEAFGENIGVARYKDYKKALLNIFKNTDPSKFDVDHISSLKFTPVHHPTNMRLQNKHRNRSEGARELDQHVKNVLLLADNIQDQIKIQGPKVTPYMRQNILRGG